MERELLLRAAKSRSKNEDPEQAKLKAKAKEVNTLINKNKIHFLTILKHNMFYF